MDTKTEIKLILLKIKQLRHDRAISQAEMATALGISTTSYAHMEQSITNLSVERLFEICKILGIDINYFFNIPEYLINKHPIWDELNRLYGFIYTIHDCNHNIIKDRYPEFFNLIETKKLYLKS